MTTFTKDELEMILDALSNHHTSSDLFFLSIKVAIEIHRLEHPEMFPRIAGDPAAVQAMNEKKKAALEDQKKLFELLTTAAKLPPDEVCREFGHPTPLPQPLDPEKILQRMVQIRPEILTPTAQTKLLCHALCEAINERIFPNCPTPQNMP